MLDDKTYLALEDLLYRYYMTEFALEKLDFEKITRDSLEKQLADLGFKVDLRQDNYNRIEVVTLNNSQSFEIEI